MPPRASTRTPPIRQPVPPGLPDVGEDVVETVETPHGENVGHASAPTHTTSCSRRKPRMSATLGIGNRLRWATSIPGDLVSLVEPGVPSALVTAGRAYLAQPGPASGRAGEIHGVQAERRKFQVRPGAALDAT